MNMCGAPADMHPRLVGLTSPNITNTALNSRRSPRGSLLMEGISFIVMKRRIAKLAVFLLLGAVVNVAVAWGFSVWGGRIDWPQFPSVRSAAESDMAWLVDLGWRPPRDTEHWKHREEIHEERYFGLTRHLFVENPRPQGLVGSIMIRHWYIAARIRAGWPMKSMEGALVFEAALERQDMESVRLFRGSRSTKTGLPSQNGPPPYDRERTLGAVRLPKSDTPGAADGHLLPLKPVLIGFAINTIFYAAILWMVTLGPFTARRMIRRKRGCCIKCGYDLRGTSGANSRGGGVCSECGAQRA